MHETTEEWRPPKRVKRNTGGRKRLQLLLTLACAVGLFVGVRAVRARRASVPALTEAALIGTWELQSLQETPVGLKPDSVVLSQRLTLQNGRIEGETRLRAATETATLALPFPDESVREVVSNPDGYDVKVTWNGVYSLVNDKLLELHIGKATYRVEARPNAQARTLLLDHDFILTYRGPAQYAADPPVPPTNQTARRP